MAATSREEPHPQRRAALAAHALREALAAAGLLEGFPECRGTVDGGRALVRLGDVDAATAMALAQRLRRRERTRPAGTRDAGRGGPS